MVRLSAPTRAGKSVPPGRPPPLEIWSGGQTGVDRAALDFARAHGLPHGGWCPRGRCAEDGVIPARYRLRETATEAYEERTRRNVRDTDATVIFAPGRILTGGTRLTRQFARALGKPLLVLTARGEVSRAAARLGAFLRRHRVRRLNVAGPRASEAPALPGYVRAVLARALVSDLAARTAAASPVRPSERLRSPRQGPSLPERVGNRRGFRAGSRKSPSARRGRGGGPG